MSRIYPQRHPHTESDTEVLAECIVIDATFANWLMARGDEPLTMVAVQDAWRAGWVEGVIRERYKPRLAPLPDADN